MKVTRNFYKMRFALFGIIILSSNHVFAHPHHENDLLGSLGLDHIFYGLVALVTFAFLFFGKLSK